MASVRRRGPPTPLRLDLPLQPSSVVAVADSINPDAMADHAPPSKPNSLRNMKKLSLSIALPSSSSVPPSPSVASVISKRRASVASLPGANASTFWGRSHEGESPSAPYLGGPIEIMPRVWLGSEDNARDWSALEERGIKSVLNVAKEVTSVFDQQSPLPSTNPNFKSTLYPADPSSGRPELYYLKLPWSHGQADLVIDGFIAGMAFVDQAIHRGDGVLIHCQCGVSRSATMAIALVMRAAASASPFTPREIASLVGMHGAYDYVKAKSKWIGPNMSLIYQLLEYERKLGGKNPSAATSEASLVDEEEWERQRRELDKPARGDDESLQEARHLDREMELRMARKDSTASSTSNHSMVISGPGGIGMGQPWRSRYGSGGHGRARAGSLESTYTTRSSVSILSEDLVEEDEEEDQANGTVRTPNTDATDEDAYPSSDAYVKPGLPLPPAQFGLAPISRVSLHGVHPPSAPPTRQFFPSFTGPSQKREKRRPPPLVSLATIPPSPREAVENQNPSVNVPSSSRPTSPGNAALRVHAPGVDLSAPTHTRRRNVPPSLTIAIPFPKSTAVAGSTPGSSLSSAIGSSTLPPLQNLLPPPLPTPSQTLFVFPPSPTLNKAPSALMLTSTPMLSSFATPKGSMFKKDGKRSWFGATTIPTPTTATARVDARGWLEAS